MEALLKGGAATDLVDKDGPGSPGARRGQEEIQFLFGGEKEDVEEEEEFFENVGLEMIRIGYD